MAFYELLRERFPALALRRDVAFSAITTLGAGGVLPLVAEPDNDVELVELLHFARQHQIKIFVIGGGSNLIGTDQEFDGVVIRLVRGNFGAIKFGRSELVTCGSGVRLVTLARACAEHGRGGLAPLTGVPGCLGGALRMNAGAHDCAIGDFVEEISGVFPDGRYFFSDGKAIQWGYRTCSLPNDLIITAVILRLNRVEPAVETAGIDAELASRRSHEPTGRTAGCMFRNVSKLDSAGRMLDATGCKDLTQGGVRVSSEHANYLLNEHGASAKNIVDLMIEMRRRVAEKFHFYLRSEAIFFDEDDCRRFYESLIAPKVAVFKGGNSSEREVSLRSGAAVAQALRNGGYQVEEFDLTDCVLPEGIEAFDVVFPVLHGGFGEDGRLQKLLEEAHIAFVGCDSVASDLVMDKIATKKLLDQIGLPTAGWRIVTPEDAACPPDEWFPLVLKAPREGSTIGIVKVESPEEWTGALAQEFTYDQRILVERFVRGVEITVPVIDGKALDVIEIRSPAAFYDYDAKYEYKNGHTQYFCPPERVDADAVRLAREYAELFYRRFGCRDLVRVDFLVDAEDGIPKLLEGNSLPGFTATSLVPKAAAVAGMSFETLTAKLVSLALARKEEKC